MPAVSGRPSRSWARGTPRDAASWAPYPSGLSHIAVRTGPGETVLTRTPRGPTSSARALPKAVRAAFAALYAIGPACGVRALVDETLTIAPPASASVRRGSAARVVRTEAKKFTSKASDHCWSVTWRKPPVQLASASPPPTLLTSRSSPPSSDRTRSTRRAGPSAAVRSTATAAASVAPSSGVIVRAAPTTRTPSSSSAFTVARPMPRLAPVTSAVFPLSRRSMRVPLSPSALPEILALTGIKSPVWR